jgi:TetR/AcrR family transcriptional repressor of mexJK operon
LISALGMDAVGDPPDDCLSSDRQARRRSGILDQALPLFLQLGFEGVSMAMIARAARGSKATLYTYFNSKADLFVALMEQSWEQLAEEPGINRDPMLAHDAIGWLTAWAADYLVHINDDTIITLHRLIIAEAVRFPNLGARLYAVGPQRGLLQLSEDLAILHQRRLLHCDDADAGSRLLRALAKSGLYERRLWGIAERPTPQCIRDEAAQVAASFLRFHPCHD